MKTHQRALFKSKNGIYWCKHLRSIQNQRLGFLMRMENVKVLKFFSPYYIMNVFMDNHSNSFEDFTIRSLP